MRASPFRGAPPLALLLALLLASCGGGDGATPPSATPPASPPPAQSLTLSGDTGRVVLGGAAVTLSATPAVAATLSWSLDEGPGTLSASSGNSVTYTPPACCAPEGRNTHVTVGVKAGDAKRAFGFWVYTPAGQPGLSLVAGSVGGAGNLDGQGDAARFAEIQDITADAAGNLLLIDALHSFSALYPGSTRVRRVSAGGAVSTLFTVPYAYGGTALSISAAADGTALLLARDANGLALYRIQPGGTVAPLLDASQTDQSAQRVVAGLNGTVYMLGARHVSVRRADGGGGVLAGNGADGDAACRDGVAGDARLGQLTDAVLDAAGNLIVADCHSVRRITPAGVVTTLAGDPADGGAARDGVGKAARFGAGLLSLSIDKHNELRVLDYDLPQFNEDGGGKPVTYRLRKLGADGAVTTLRSGTLPGGGLFQARFDQQTVAGVPGAYKFVRALADGVVVVATAGQLYKYDGAAMTTLAGNEGDITAAAEGPVATARIAQPRALGAHPDGTLYVMDAQGAVYQVTRGGRVGKLFQGDYQLGGLPASQILYRGGGLYDGLYDGLYLSHVRQPSPNDRAQSGGALIELRRGSDAYLTSTVVAGSAADVPYQAARVDGPGKDATFYKADLLGFDTAGNLYVEDERNAKPLYRKIAPDGVVSTVAAPPADLGADQGAGQGGGQDGYRYAYDQAAGLVYRIAPAGDKTVVAGAAGQYGIRPGALPGGLAGPPSGPSTAPLLPLTPTAPNTYAFISGAAILQLVPPPAGAN